jgi:uncharacterized protein (DUF924 family)
VAAAGIELADEGRPGEPLTAGSILSFWFTEHGPDDWFAYKADFDAKVVSRFGETLRRAAACEFWRWRDTPDGRLAEIIVLDQFSRQIHRGKAAAFASDPLALALAQEAVRTGDDQRIAPPRRVFLYLPYMHSESLAVHDEAVRLFTALGNADTLDFERKHRAVIARFGRYPKRNAALGRESTAEELAYIAEIGDRAF